MSRLTKYVAWTMFVLLGVLVACDNIPEDERLIYVKPAAVSRTVLIEDFTGQRCVNCPNATEAIEQLIEQYGDSGVIAVGIHSGPFARNTNGTTLPLWTAEGDEYFSYFGVEQQPSGMVNRLSVSNYTDWPALVYNEIQQTAPLSIQLEVELNEETRSLAVTSSMMATDGNVNGKLQLWLVEDSIVSPQYMPDGKPMRDYVHNHVFRQSINGTWGEDVSIPEGEKRAIQSSMDIAEAYDMDRLSVVAFVYNSTGVLQAAKIRIKNL
ncbi:MAG: Omp28 family outer membrane lipoprotein [Muribaculaceae bacterium]|nr:Omp28 family outer membrane lipoprotein [Muribaculaceae bacterium]